MTRTMNFNITSDQRKEFAQTVAEYFHGEAKYTMPGFRYVIGDKATIMKDGTLVIKDEASEDVPYLLDYLGTNGFRLDEEEAEQTQEEPDAANDEIITEDNPADEEISDDAETDEEVEEPEVLSISLPDDLTDEEFSRLEELLAAKATILKHAFKSDGITVERKDGKITFDGFPAIDGDHTKACMKFVTLLTEFAKHAQRIVSTDHEVENEKYYFRIFLIRLGMNGPEHKQIRKILLENLSGNAAFKTDAQLKAHTEKWKEKRAAEKEAEAEEEQEGEDNADAE